MHLVRPFIAKRDTRFRKAFPVEKRVAFASLQNQRQSQNQFCKCITEMASNFIVFPKTERETAGAIIRFAGFSKCKIPEVVGATDGVQIERSNRS